MILEEHEYDELLDKAYNGIPYSAIEIMCSCTLFCNIDEIVAELEKHEYIILDKP